MAATVAGLLMLGVFVGPLIARLVFDRRIDRANAVAADIRSVVRQRLGGDSMVSVQVEPAGMWSPGRVRLSAPSGYQALIAQVWSVVVKHVPDGYELVVRGAPAPASVPAAVPPLSRAA